MNGGNNHIQTKKRSYNSNKNGKIRCDVDNNVDSKHKIAATYHPDVSLSLRTSVSGVIAAFDGTSETCLVRAIRRYCCNYSVALLALDHEHLPLCLIRGWGN